MTRKVIQIAVAERGGYGGANMYAVCDDGSVWFHYGSPKDPWRLLGDIPAEPLDEIRAKERAAADAEYRVALESTGLPADTKPGSVVPIPNPMEHCGSPGFLSGIARWFKSA